MTKSLGVRDTGRRLILEDVEENYTLIHELVHAMRNHGDRGLPIWAVEGFAEYTASAPYRRGGSFSFDDRLGDAVAYVRKRKGVGETFVFPVNLQGLLEASRETFYQEGAGGLGKESLRFYAAVTLVMTYFWHKDQGDGDSRPGGRIRAWLKIMQESGDEEEARALLLGGRSYEDLQKEIVKAYRRYLDIEFP